MGSINRHRQAIDGPGPGSFHGIQPGAKADRARDQAEDKAAPQGQSPSRRQGQKQGCIQHLSKGSQETTCFYNTVLRSIHNAGPERGLEMHTQNKTQAVSHLALPCTLNVLHAADRPPDSDISLIMGNLLHTFLIL